MLKRKELLTESVTLDDQVYTVSAMTVHQRTEFEKTLLAVGNSYMRESLLIHCCSLNGAPIFPRDTYLELGQEFFPYDGKADEDTINKAEKKALQALCDEIATYPYEQLEPLVMAAMRVNGLLGNGSPQS